MLLDGPFDRRKLRYVNDVFRSSCNVFCLCRTGFIQQWQAIDSWSLLEHFLRQSKTCALQWLTECTHNALLILLSSSHWFLSRSHSGIYEAEQSAEGYEFVSTCYKPKSFQLYQLIEPIKENYQQTNHSRSSSHKYPWEKFLDEGIQYLLSHNIDCLPPATDRLHIKMENGEVVEVKHPSNGSRDHLRPTLRFGMIAGGKNILTNDYFKTTLSEKCNVLCFDLEIDQVIAAVQGNRIESFMIIRGISDYHDGTLNKEWQPFSALCAAAFMKTVIYQIPSKRHSKTEPEDIL